MRLGRLVCAVVGLALGACGGGATYGTYSSPMPAPAPVPTSVLADLLGRADIDGRPVDDAAGPPGAVPQARATLVVVFASWCEHCHDELAVIAGLRAAHPALRVIGVNYRGHEEYDQRGNSEAVRNYVRNYAPWLRVVPADERLFDELGRPPKIPTMYVYDGGGALVQVYDRQLRDMPDRAELEALFARLGA